MTEDINVKTNEELKNTEDNNIAPEDNSEKNNENSNEITESENIDNATNTNENEELEDNPTPKEEEQKQEKTKDSNPSKNILEDIVPVPDREEQKEIHIPEDVLKLKKELEAASKKVQNKEINVEEYFIISNKYLDSIAKMDNKNQQNKLIRELRSNVENTRIEPTLYIGGIDVENLKNKVYNDYTMEILEYKDNVRNITVHFAKSREKDLRYEYPSFLIHLTWIPLLIGIFLLKYTISFFKKEIR